MRETKGVLNEGEGAMKKFEIVMQIFNYGKGVLEAEESAGELIDVSKMCGGMMIRCGSTVELEVVGGSEYGKGDDLKRYITEFRVTLESECPIDAGDKVRYLLRSSGPDSGVIVRFTPAEILEEKAIPVNFFSGRFRKPSARNERNVFIETS
jgi:hypothetical protein